MFPYFLELCLPFFRQFPDLVSNRCLSNFPHHIWSEDVIILSWIRDTAVGPFWFRLLVYLVGSSRILMIVKIILIYQNNLPGILLSVHTLHVPVILQMVYSNARTLNWDEKIIMTLKVILSVLCNFSLSVYLMYLV